MSRVGSATHREASLEPDLIDETANATVTTEAPHHSIVKYTTPETAQPRLLHIC